MKIDCGITDISVITISNNSKYLKRLRSLKLYGTYSKNNK